MKSRFSRTAFEGSTGWLFDCLMYLAVLYWSFSEYMKSANSFESVFERYSKLTHLSKNDFGGDSSAPPMAVLSCGGGTCFVGAGGV